MLYVLIKLQNTTYPETHESVFCYSDKKYNFELEKIIFFRLLNF